MREKGLFFTQPVTIGVLSARDRIKSRGWEARSSSARGSPLGPADVGRRMIYCCSVLGGIWPPSQSPGLVAGREGGQHISKPSMGKVGLAVTDGAAIPKEIYF